MCSIPARFPKCFAKAAGLPISQERNKQTKTANKAAGEERCDLQFEPSEGASY